MIDRDDRNVEYYFGNFRLLSTRPELWRGDESIELTRKRHDILLFLVRNHRKPLPKDELIRAIWPTKEVEESNLSNQIHGLRRLIEEDPSNPRIIVTIPGVGYQFDEEVTHSPRSGEVSPHSPQQMRRGGRILPTILVLLILVTGFLLLLLRKESDRVSQTPNPVPITHYPGTESYPSLSPNGQFLAFAWDGNTLQKSDLYVKQVDGGDPIRLTTNPQEEILPTWSPDGKRIAFLRQAKEVGGPLQLLVIPALGGMEREVAKVGWGLDWSPDGNYLAVVNLAEENIPPGIQMIKVDGTGHLTLTSRTAGDAYFASTPRFSPDGKSLAFVRWWSDAPGEIHTIDLETGDIRQVTFDKAVISNASLHWTNDSRELLFVSNRSGSFVLWKISRTGGESEPVFNLHVPIEFYSISRESNDLAFVPKLDDTLIEVFSNQLENTNQNEGGRCLINSSRVELGPRFSQDGLKLVFTSNRTGWEEIWTANADCTESRQLTNFKVYGAGSPRWSPDGKSITFDRRVDGRPEIFTIGSDGSGLRRITNTLGSTRPFWAPDGESIYFTLYTPGSSNQEQIWSVNIASGQMTQVTMNGGSESVLTPDGRRLYYSKDHYLYQKDLPLGVEIPVPGMEKIQVDRYWDVVKSSIFYIPFYHGEEPAIYHFDLQKRKTSLVRRLDKKPMAWQIGLSISSDEKLTAVCLINQNMGDILMIRNWK